MSAFTKQQVEQNNARRRAEEIAMRALTAEGRRRHMEAKRAGKKSPVVMDEFKRLGLITEKKNDNPPRPEIPNAEFERDKAPALGGSRKSPRWSNDEDAILTALYEKMRTGVTGLQNIAAVVGRSEAACACRANALGLTAGRGQRFRPKRGRKSRVKYHSKEEISEAISSKKKAWHALNPHPMLGKEVPQYVRDKISLSNMGKVVSPEQSLKAMKSRVEKYGTLAPPNMGRGSWKAAWREIGGQRIFARSRWEANYARYLQWLLERGEIKEWEHEPDTFWFEKIKRGVRSYLPDFRIKFSDGSVEYHEVKGWMDARSKTKIKRMAKYFPNIVLCLIEASWFKANRTIAAIIPGWEKGRIK